MRVFHDPGTSRHAPLSEFRGKSGGMVAYPECPDRARRIAETLGNKGYTEFHLADQEDLSIVAAVHDEGLLAYINTAWSEIGEPTDMPVIPDVFALRSLSKKPASLFALSAYYCSDAQTPIVQGTRDAAFGSLACAISAALEVVDHGETISYALCRPPGHHAGRDYFGGYCYLNNAAAAAETLTRAGARVGIIDIDFHHGNGTQDIMYHREDVAFTSIHADPAFTYPYFAGYADEKGEADGADATMNVPVPRTCDEGMYMDALGQSTNFIHNRGADILVISLGTDIYRGDAVGGLDIGIDSFRLIGSKIGQSRIPSVVVQEGGYDLSTIGQCVSGFLEGFLQELA